MTSPKTTSAKDAEREADARARAAEAVHAIDVWCSAALLGQDGDEAITRVNCSMLQVTARAIEESLQEASESDSGPRGSLLMFAANLVGIVETALLNLLALEENHPPTRDALIGTMRMARSQLLERMAAAEQAPAAAEVSHG